VKRSKHYTAMKTKSTPFVTAWRLLAALALISSTLVVHAQALVTRRITAGGGGLALAGVYCLADTLGQTAVGVASSADYTVDDGFWPDTFVAASAGTSVNWPAPVTITYGTPLSGVQLNGVPSVPGTLAYNPPAGTMLNAGSNQLLRVVFTPDDPENYAMSAAQVYITVLKAPVTPTADSHTRAYGDPNPALTISYTGLVNGDTAASISSPPTLTTSATTNSVPGVYAVSVSAGSDSNYELTPASCS
jgi:MBG domain (YGX type)